MLRRPLLYTSFLFLIFVPMPAWCQDDPLALAEKVCDVKESDLILVAGIDNGSADCAVRLLLTGRYDAFAKIDINKLNAIEPTTNFSITREQIAAIARANWAVRHDELPKDKVDSVLAEARATLLTSKLRHPMTLSETVWLCNKVVPKMPERAKELATIIIKGDVNSRIESLPYFLVSHRMLLADSPLLEVKSHCAELLGEDAIKDAFEEPVRLFKDNDKIKYAIALFNFSSNSEDRAAAAKILKEGGEDKLSAQISEISAVAQYFPTSERIQHQRVIFHQLAEQYKTAGDHNGYGRALLYEALTWRPRFNAYWAKPPHYYATLGTDLIVDVANGDAEQADKLLLQAENEFRAVSNSTALYKCLILRASSAKKIDDAADHILEYLAGSKTSAVAKAKLLRSAAGAYEISGKYEKAIECYEANATSLREVLEQGTTEQFVALIRGDHALNASGQAGKNTEVILIGGAEDFGQDLIFALCRLYYIYKQKGDPEKAQSYLRQAKLLAKENNKELPISE
jgi:tetratricopeptide (TPR) repeat protein